MHEVAGRLALDSVETISKLAAIGTAGTSQLAAGLLRQQRDGSFDTRMRALEAFLNGSMKEAVELPQLLDSASVTQPKIEAAAHSLSPEKKDVGTDPVHSQT